MTEGLMVEESESDVVDERREHQRVEVEFPVEIQAPVETDAQALELSEGGIRIEVGEDFSHAMHVSLRFDLPSLSAPVGTLADIRWHEQSGPKADPRWIYGLRFSDLAPDVQEALGAYIDDLQSDDD